MSQFDLVKYLEGNWKRCLEIREFGGTFQHIKCINTFLSFEKVIKSDQTFLKWTISKNDVKTVYDMKLTFGEGEILVSDPNQNLTGRYLPIHKTLIITILSNTVWNMTFRIMDDNQMAFNMSQIDTNPVIQYGSVFRINQ